MLKERNERKRLMDEAQERKERPRKQLEQGFNVYNHLEKKPAKKVAVKKHKTVQDYAKAWPNWGALATSFSVGATNSVVLPQLTSNSTAPGNSL